jgi:lipopolysaccharide transport system permease protein
MRVAQDAIPITRVTARQAVSPVAYVRELWQRKRLAVVLASRELKASYEMNVVGFVWWLLEPLSLTLVYVIVVDLIFKNGAPNYPLFVLVALLPFKWLSQSLTASMNTVRANAPLVTDLYFPRALLPIAEDLTGLAHFAVGLLVVPIFMAVYTIPPTWNLLWIPLIALVQFVFTLGLSYPLSVWGVNYRNLAGLTGNVLRLWFYLSPGLWDLRQLSRAHQSLARLNPLVGVFQGYRNVILEGKPPTWDLGYTAAVGVVAILVGGWYFIRREAQFGKMV